MNNFSRIKDAWDGEHPKPKHSGHTQEAEHAIRYRVYYRDSDAAGVMYYARYADLFEMGRTELFRMMGVNVRALQDQGNDGIGIVFPVASLNVRYRKPAYLDDLLLLKTRLVALSAARISCCYQLFCLQKNGKSEVSRGKDDSLMSDDEPNTGERIASSSVSLHMSKLSLLSSLPLLAEAETVNVAASLKTLRPVRIPAALKNAVEKYHLSPFASR